MSRQIRVIAGKYRGQQLIAPQAKAVRITKERAKEAVFSALSRYINGRNVLDLFAGSGSLGIESLSRGAHSCIFNEIDFKTFQNLKTNTNFITEEISLHCKDYRETLELIPKNSISLVFLDPPYSYEMAEILTEVMAANILTNDAIIVCETNEKFNFVTINEEVKHYRYGNTHITIIWREK
ncbi:MAG TPA: 16S rRNA (guanine(966)-N(2))-methyltransferase RsmD [Bacilli bacterium]|nr:16S rRNA (guanine(966)-N(2))-methyltransferase RsmD [Bacilli bacterium]